MDRSRVAGAVLGTAGGVLLAVGAQLPWERLVGSTPYHPGCFGCGYWTIEFSGWQIGNGALVFIAGLVTAASALLPVVFSPARRLSAIVLAAALVVAAAATGGWWLKHPTGAVASVGIIELAGVILGLAAVTFSRPGPARMHRSWLVTTVLLCVLGIVLAWPRSAPLLVSF